ncbi:MAG: arsenite efflux transporter metallochaperone ArsD [Gemmatimonadota bacterium]
MNDMVLRVFDQPMCCSTGVCGPDVDPALVRFAADLDWLRRQGVTVQRFNPSREPRAFASHAAVRRALVERGSRSLPLVLWGEATVASGAYPDRGVLGRAVGLPRAGAPAEAGGGA